MRMTAKTSDRILKAVTGKEGFQLLVGRYIGMLGGEAPALGNADMDAMIAGLYRCPEEAYAYNKWCRAMLALHFISGETRVLAMRAAWHVGVIVAMTNQYLAADYSADSADNTEKWIKQAHMQATGTQAMLDDLARLSLILEAFGEVLKCDIPLLAREEIHLLEGSVRVYNDMLVEGLKHTPGCALPRLTITSSDIPADLRDRLIAAIERGVGGTFLTVLDALDRKLRCL